MTTAFKHAISICGLTQPEAADFFNVSLPTVKKWCQGRRTVSQGVWNELAVLYSKMQVAADNALDLIDELTDEHGQFDEIDFTSSGAHGQWPSQNCALAVEAMVRLELNRKT